MGKHYETKISLYGKLITGKVDAAEKQRKRLNAVEYSYTDSRNPTMPSKDVCHEKQAKAFLKSQSNDVPKEHQEAIVNGQHENLEIFAQLLDTPQAPRVVKVIPNEQA